MMPDPHLNNMGATLVRLGSLLRAMYVQGQVAQMHGRPVDPRVLCTAVGLAQAELLRLRRMLDGLREKR